MDKHFCATCGIEFQPTGQDGSDFQSYCAMCVYGPYLTAAGLAEQVEKYAGAIHSLLTTDPVDLERLIKLDKTLLHYWQRLQRELNSLEFLVVGFQKND